MKPVEMKAKSMHGASKRKQMKRQLKKHAEKTWAAEREAAKQKPSPTILRLAIAAFAKWWHS